MAVGFSNTNKPLNPRGQDASPKGYNRASLFSGKALDFDGVNDYIQADGVNETLDNYTLSWNLKTTSTQNYSNIFSNSTNLIDIYIMSNGQLRFYTDQGYNSTNLPPVNDGQWKNLVLSISGTSLNIYVNGVLSETLSITDVSRSIANIRLGYIFSNLYAFNGEMAGFKIFNTALTTEQVADLYNNPEKVVPTGVDNTALKLWLPMMEGAGTTAYDGSGNGNHGTISGATYVNGIGAPSPQSAVMDWNKYSITDTTDYANVSSTTIASEGTIVFKHVPLASVDGSYMFAYGSNQLGRTRSIRQNSGKYGFVGYGSGGQDFNTTQDIEVGKITNVAYSWNSSSDVKVYVDGVKVGDATKTLNPIIASSVNVNSNLGEGQIHNQIMFYAGLYDEVLTESQIQDIQDGTTNPESVSGLVHFWRNSNDWQDEVGSADLTENDNAGKVLFPQTLTNGRDLAGNTFANVRKQGALNLDGNSWAEVHKNDSIPEGDEGRTLECWFFAVDRTHTQSYMETGNNSGTNKRFAILTISSNIIYIAGQIYDINTGTLADLNAWNHVVVTHDGSTAKVYKNGSLIKTVTGRTYTTALDTVSIGRNLNNVIETSNGAIAQPRIYNRALTAEEVQRSYDSNKNIYTNS